MARNMVQFQKGLSEPGFERLYGTEEQCRAAVVASRWPDGFVCPACGGTRHSVVKTRGLYQCSACRVQTSPIAGTIFASTKLKLRVWFRALYHLTQTKQGISSIELGRRLGVTQTTAWKIKHKLGQVMLERDDAKRLTGRIEIDDAYIGGERTGGKRGRGAPGKTPFVAAVETTPGGKPVRLKLRRVRLHRGLRQARPRPRLHRAQRRPRLLQRRHERGMRPSGPQDRLGAESGENPRLQMGQHRSGKHQGRNRRHVPLYQPEARAALPRRVRVPLQPALRSRSHDTAPHMGQRPNPTHALSPPETG